jgi:hypothetical protein
MSLLWAGFIVNQFLKRDTAPLGIEVCVHFLRYLRFFVCLFFGGGSFLRPRHKTFPFSLSGWASQRKGSIWKCLDSPTLPKDWEFFTAGQEEGFGCKASCTVCSLP